MHSKERRVRLVLHQHWPGSQQRSRSQQRRKQTALIATTQQRYPDSYTHPQRTAVVSTDQAVIDLWQHDCSAAVYIAKYSTEQQLLTYYSPTSNETQDHRYCKIRYIAKHIGPPCVTSSVRYSKYGSNYWSTMRYRRYGFSKIQHMV